MDGPASPCSRPRRIPASTKRSALRTCFRLRLALYQIGAPAASLGCFHLSRNRPSLISVTGVPPAMQTRVRKVAHVLERLGLAMAGAASGLFVAALVGTSHSALTNQAFLLVMM